MCAHNSTERGNDVNCDDDVGDGACVVRDVSGVSYVRLWREVVEVVASGSSLSFARPIKLSLIDEAVYTVCVSVPRTSTHCHELHHFS